MSARRAPLALYLEVRDEWGLRRLCATPVYLTDSGEIRNPVFEWSGRFNDVADLEITAQVDTGANPCAGGAAYGFRACFAPLRVELAQARYILATLRRIDRGLVAAEKQRGPVAVGDFHTYLTRVAQILGVTAFRVRATAAHREMTGERFRALDGAGLHRWLAEAAANRYPVITAGRAVA